jgi:cupin fold WbuC family metalloprotein
LEAALFKNFHQDKSARSTSYFAARESNGVDMTMIAKLKELSMETGRKKNYRICLHSSPASEFHNMVILEHKNSRYYRPHRHEAKQETIHLIEGRAAVIIFTYAGTIEQIMPMSADKMIIARLGADTYHTVIPLSDQVIYHESKPGPFLGEDDSLFPDWSPNGTDDNMAKAYIDALIKKVS